MRGTCGYLMVALAALACSGSRSSTTAPPGAATAAPAATTDGDAAALAPAPSGWPATLSLSPDNGCFTRGGQVLCWGDNEDGVLGDPSLRSRDDAAPVAGIDDAVAVAVMWTEACALGRGGDVTCWGRSGTPHRVLQDVIALDASLNHVCALRRGGKVSCWGDSRERAHGQAAEQVETPTEVAGLAEIEAIATAYARTCALRRGGTVMCWGAALVDDEKPSAVPAVLPDAKDVDAIWGGVGTICVRRRTGDVACVTRTPDGTVLAPIEDWRGARQVSSANGGTCALLDDGRLSCLGDSGARSDWWIDPLNAEHTTIVTGSGEATAVAARTRLCVLDAAGLPRCRGTAEVYSPRAVHGIDDAVTLTGGSNGSCVIRRSKQIWCWGAFNSLGSKASAPELLEVVLDPVQLHVGRELCVIDGKARLHCRHGYDSTPEQKLTRVKQLSTIGFHTCALRTDGTITCWGYNSKGELGDGTTTTVPEDKPVQVRGVRDAVEVAAGYQFTCARLRSGTVSCWGAGASDRMHEPAIDDAVELVAGTNFACARRRSGNVACWGGSIPDLVPDQPYFVDGLLDVPDIRDAVDLDAGDHDLCLVRATGAVVCAGRFTGRREDDPPLLAIAGIDDAVSVTMGDRHVCALRKNGGVLCFGHDANGAVGDGAAEELRPIPIRVR